jgi:hypothetical protein
MIPGKYNMICPQGATFTKRLTWTIDEVPVDLTGYTGKMQARFSYGSKCDPIFTLTTENGGISVDDEGNVDLLIDSDDTEGFVAKEYLYDLELSSGSEKYRLVEGKFIITPEVTI